jgi:hypothetical protein
MNKLILAITLAATVAAVAPANAETRASSSIKVGNQCFKPTDSARGYGYWTSCDKVYSFAVTRPHLNIIPHDVLVEIENGGGTEGGGGGDGGGGGGGGR